MSLKKERAAVVDTVVGELKDVINLSHKEIVEKRVNSKMPLEVFKKYFLPYFSGEYKIEKDNSIVYKWIEYAGSIHAEMDIIDEQGNVIDTIPPIINQIDLNENLKNNMDMTEIGNIYKQKQDISAAAANDYLRTFTNTLANNIIESDSGFKTKIAEYSNSNKNSKNSDNINDELLYD